MTSMIVIFNSHEISWLWTEIWDFHLVRWWYQPLPLLGRAGNLRQFRRRGRSGATWERQVHCMQPQSQRGALSGTEPNIARRPPPPGPQGARILVMVPPSDASRDLAGWPSPVSRWLTVGKAFLILSRNPMGNVGAFPPIRIVAWGVVLSTPCHLPPWQSPRSPRITWSCSPGRHCSSQKHRLVWWRSIWGCTGPRPCPSHTPSRS